MKKKRQSRLLYVILHCEKKNPVARYRLNLMGKANDISSLQSIPKQAE